MLKLLIVLAVIVLALMRGGSLRHLASLQLRMPALAIIGFAVQAGVYIFFRGAAPLQAVAPVLFVGSLLMIVVWCGINYRLPGMLVVMVGVLMNTAAIAANGGFMPVWADASRYAGYLGPEPLPTPEYDRRWMTTDDPSVPLLALGDVLAMPSWMPLASVWSIGDVFLVVGICVLCWRTIQSAPADVADRNVLVEEHA